MLEFKNPPASTRRAPRRDWVPIAAQLRDNPGHWACVGEQINVSVVNAIRDQKVKALLKVNGFEVTTANNDLTSTPRVADVYLRYNPDLDVSLTLKEREAQWRIYRKNQKENEG